MGIINVTPDSFYAGSRFTELTDILQQAEQMLSCLLYTSDAADERSSVDLGGRRIIKKKTKDEQRCRQDTSIINTEYHTHE